jgi:acetoin utilization protein AcuB
MFVSDWMTTKVYTVDPDSTVTDAMILIREKKVKHIPVLKGEELRGIVSDTDIRDYSPSTASSLDIYELHYLLGKARVKEIMKKDVVTIGADAPIEEAAMLLCDRDIGSLPVLDGKKLVGIISDRDIFRALVDITGVRHGGHRICLQVADRPGSIREVTDLVRKHGFHLQGILTSYEGLPEGRRNIVIRTHGGGDFVPLKAELFAAYQGVRIKEG